MYYVSAVRWDGDVKRYGITDTTDNVVEYYTKQELLVYVRTLGVMIHGVVHTGSDLHIRIQTVTIVQLSQLQKKGSISGYFSW